MSRVATWGSIREYFDRNVQEWDTLRYQDETYLGRGRIGLGWLKLRKSARVLDLGCGTGHQTLEAVRQGHHVVSMDFSYEMARATRNRLLKEVPGAPLTVVVGDALHPPFREGAFDAVVALGVVGFIPDRPALVEQVHTLIAPGGEMIADVALPEDQVLFQRISAALDRVARPVVSAFSRLLLRGPLPAATKATGFYTAAFVKHRPDEFRELLRSRGFEPVAYGGTGFGDLRVLGRGVVPWRVQMRLTRILTSLSQLPGGGWLTRHALIHVVRAARLEKSSTPAVTSTVTRERVAAQRKEKSPAGVLFVANFAAGTGYAWGTIEKVMQGIGERISNRGARAFIAYPEVSLGATEPGSLSPVLFDYQRTRTPGGMLAFIRLLRRHRIRVLYLTDLESWSWRYPLFRLGGVRSVILHDRTSGVREKRGATGTFLKQLLHRIPTLAADHLIGVSDFVAERLISANGAPAERVSRVHNGIPLSRFSGEKGTRLYDRLSLSPDTSVIFCSGRAQKYKGFSVLIEAAQRLSVRRYNLAFVHCGDGPDLPELRDLVEDKGLNNFYFLGSRSDTPDLLSSATIAVVPSLWEEAFGLTVVEAMAAGVPVIASRIGGIPELIEDGKTGVLVPPGDAKALEEALVRLLDDPELRASLASAAREKAGAEFGMDRVVSELSAIVEGELGSHVRAAAATSAPKLGALVGAGARSPSPRLHATAGPKAGG